MTHFEIAVSAMLGILIGTVLVLGFLIGMIHTLLSSINANLGLIQSALSDVREQNAQRLIREAKQQR